MRITFMATVVCEHHHPIISLIAETEGPVADEKELEDDMERSAWSAHSAALAGGQIAVACPDCGSVAMHVHVERVPNVPEEVSAELKKVNKRRQNALMNPN